jgi:beta-lactamase class A
MRRSMQALTAFAGVMVMVVSGPPAAEPRVPESIRAHVERFRGVIGVAATSLDTGETIAVDADTRFPTASLIKVAVMVEAFHQMAEGRLDRDTIVTLSDADKVGDETVVLNQLHAGLPLTVPDLVNLTIAFSDNTATNLLIRLVGTANVTRRMASYGLVNTKLFRPTFRDGHADVFPEEEREFGLGMTTPREAARLFELLARGQVVNRAMSDEMLKVLEGQTDRTMIPRSLPYESGRIVVASKSGSDAEKHADKGGVKRHVRTDAALVRGPRARYVIAICARQVEDTRSTVDNDALVTGAAISRAVYDHFSRAAR